MTFDSVSNFATDSSLTNQIDIHKMLILGEQLNLLNVTLDLNVLGYRNKCRIKNMQIKKSANKKQNKLFMKLAIFKK